MARTINLYIPDQDMRKVERFARRLKRDQRQSLSEWFCRRCVEELDRIEATEKLLTKSEETV